MSFDTISFADLGLPSPLCEHLSSIGYVEPSPIQAQSIPALLEGKDVLGLAQTGTGKTAAFSLPILANIERGARQPQALILAPTRELAVQVAEALQTYAKHVSGFKVAPIYGGQDMRSQLRQLKQGVSVVVGTPGRIMDHLRRGSLDLSQLKTVVLDEADEMLRMGFIDDVEWILEHTPKEKQVALFSATMPGAIKKITARYLNEPVRVQIEAKTKTVDRIEQQFIMVHGARKQDALLRVLEVESFDGLIMFVRTKTATVELAQFLESRGYASAALNGDINQKQREMTIDQLKNGKIDIVIATDVAARGIDVPRVTHVVNYDIPFDNEAYVHRIGRTGRAGRSGKAILLVTPRERHLLRSIERSIGQPIQEARLPTAEQLSERRQSSFKERIAKAAAREDLDKYQAMITQWQADNSFSQEELLSALVFLAQENKPLFVDSDRQLDESVGNPKRDRRDGKKRDPSVEKKTRKQREAERAQVPMDCYRVHVGRKDGVRPGDLVGAIANEADIESRYIGNIMINDDHSYVELPEGMPKPTKQVLQRLFVKNKALNMEKLEASEAPKFRRGRSPSAEEDGQPRRRRRDNSGSRPRRRSDAKRRPNGEHSSSDRRSKVA